MPKSATVLLFRTTVLANNNTTDTVCRTTSIYVVILGTFCQMPDLILFCEYEDEEFSRVVKNI
jgi:hypothetical protein